MKFSIQQVAVTASTNDDAKAAAERGEAEGLVIWALKQTSGRGRQGRTWESPEGNLYCSVLLRPNAMPNDIGLYSFVAANAMYDTVIECLGLGESRGVPSPLRGGLGRGECRQETPSPAKTKDLAKAKPKFSLPLPQGERNKVALKWPNDVLVEGKKIGGILIEVTGDALIIGMGMNVMHHPPEGLYPSTSLRDEDATPKPLDEILDMLLQNLGHWYGIMKKDGFQPIREFWLKRAATGPMKVRLPQGQVDGDFAGLDDNGCLRLHLADGTEQAIATGDVFIEAGGSRLEVREK